MKSTKLSLALTLANLVLLVVLLAQGSVATRAEGAAPILRGRALEIVDDQGRVRASISVLPAARPEGGVATMETVLLRLITERGRPSVKIGASEEAAGLTVVGPTGTRDTYAILQARDETSTLRLRSESGKEQLIKP